MPVTLAIDTSTRHGRLAVATGETVVFAAEFTSERSHNSQIFKPLKTALGACGDKGPERIVVGTGPGSYTGVRIGIAAGLGIAMANKVPIAGARSIDFAAAAGVDESHTMVGDARRGSVFVARIDGSNSEPELTSEPALPDGPLFSFDPTAPMEGIALTHPSAARMATFAATLSGADFDQLAAIPPEPIYLSAPFITQPKKPGKAVPKT